ncbi:MAG: 6,7-dimethyl-8-ribityllumazine synthase [Opitutaceae bacterium]|nr:6,7-dimethyl-8-ribityllumazine synthase [Opitutaceae bacterium]
MSKLAPPATRIDGSSFRLAVAAACYNRDYVDALLGQVLTTLAAAGVKQHHITVVRVPGSNELPVAVQLLAEKMRPDCLIALGVIIRGGTSHHELIAHGVTGALQQVALAARLPVINGVVVVNSEKQAELRTRGRLNRGAEFARAALEMVVLKRSCRAKK